MQPALSLSKVRKPWVIGEKTIKPRRGERKPLDALAQIPPPQTTAYNTGGFAAINSTNRLSFRNSANSASL